MATYNKFEKFVELLASGSHSFPADEIRVYLSNDPPTASSDAETGSVTGIAVQNGYEGSYNISASLSRTGGTVSVTTSDTVVISATGTVGPFQYVVAYNHSEGTAPLICWWDYGTPVTLGNGESFTIDFTTDTLFTLT